MKVRELIEILQGLDQEKDICMADYDSDYGYALGDINEIMLADHIQFEEYVIGHAEDVADRLTTMWEKPKKATAPIEFDGFTQIEPASWKKK